MSKESEIFNRLVSFNYSNVAFRKQMFIKKEENEITIDFLNEIRENLKNNKLSENLIKTPNFEVNENNEDLYLEKVDKKLKDRYINITLLHREDINLKNENNIFPFSFFTKKIPLIKVPIDKLIIYMHGGGFVASSTAFHEGQLGNWSNKLNIPIIGIDYGLSPENKYPKALDDVYQAFNWIVKHSKDIFGINPEKIILCGDSSGGNLALSLTYLQITLGKRVPDLLVLYYPCANTSKYQFNPGMLLSMEDDILDYKFLCLCNESYRGNYKDEKDPFLNPEYVDDIILEKMPKSIFYFGSRDPLRDGTIKLIYKLANKGRDVKGYELKDYIHGFCDWDENTSILQHEKFFLKDIKNFFNELNI